MNFPFFKEKPKSILGVDIGTSAVKIVELSKKGERIKLDNFGELKAQALYQKPFRTFEKNTLLFLTQDVALAIKGIIKEAKIEGRQAIFSLPDFSSFFTNVELPPMTEEELPEAVNFEARRHIPLPFSEVILDWSIIEGRPSQDRKGDKIKVLMVAVPKEIIYQYQEIADKAGLELIALEAEVFGLIRSLTDKDKGVVALIDIGAQSTTMNMVDKGILKKSHSFDLGSNELTRVIAESKNIDFWKAEELKGRSGLTIQGGEEDISNILLPLVDLIVKELQDVVRDFTQSNNKEISQYILAGGAAYLPGLSDYLYQKLQKEVVVGDPFNKIFTPPILSATLKEMGPSFAIAVGMSLRGFM